MMRWSWKKNVATLLKIMIVYSIVWLLMPLMILRPLLSVTINFLFYTLLAFFIIHLIRSSVKCLSDFGIFQFKDTKIEISIMPYFDSTRHSFLHSLWPIIVLERKVQRSVGKNA